MGTDAGRKSNANLNFIGFFLVGFDIWVLMREGNLNFINFIYSSFSHQ